MTNSIDSDILNMNTLDRKLHRRNTMMEKIVPLIKEGFSDAEIAELTGSRARYVYQLRWNLANPQKHLKHLANRAVRLVKEREREARRRKRQQAKERASTASNAAPIVDAQMDLFSPIIEPAVLNPTMEIVNTGTLANMVNNPPHYNMGGISVFDFIEAKQLNYGRGNVIKYVSRAGVKDAATELQDLEKAQWYLTAEINKLKGVK